MNSHQEPHISMEIINKNDNPHGMKGYMINQGGRNAYSGFRGRHSYLKTEVKQVEADVKPNNTLDDDKSNSPEMIEKEPEKEDTMY